MANDLTLPFAGTGGFPVAGTPNLGAAFSITNELTGNAVTGISKGSIPGGPGQLTLSIGIEGVSTAVPIDIPQPPGTPPSVLISIGVRGTSGSVGKNVASIGVSGSGNIGVSGESTGNGIGVEGKSGGGVGVQGEGSTGVKGISGTGNGVVGDSEQSDAVVGFAHANGKAGVLGLAPDGNALAGISDRGTGIFAKGAAFAGFFAGNVDITGKLNHHGGDFNCEGNISTAKNISAFDVALVGGDCAEEFDSAASGTIEPGTVMVIDEEGAVKPSEKAYDRRVAGIISGAGDFKPGLTLDRRGSGTNRLPIALIGKVYCKVDAQYSVIKVGDLLTTSPTAGHAMKAADRLNAFGAVIGKALRSIESGQGLIPVLVALQ